MLSLLLAILFSTQAPAEQIVYGVSPYFISHGQNVKGLEAIRRRLPEIQELGANIVWLQPVTPPNEPGHGYDVVDYRSVWSELGTRADLKKLVRDTHDRGMRLMLDVVLNHSSDRHPFARDVALRGRSSPYFDFYQRQDIPNAPYAQYFNSREIGASTFFFYFWPDLLNFNFESRALREYLFGTLEFWVREFDIDGFRFDASWAPSSRAPDFYASIARRLRKIKPDIILMAEDKIGYPTAYAGSGHPHLEASGFDWAYDWNNEDPHWVSKWSFMIEPETYETVFNTPDAELAAEYFVKGLSYSQTTTNVRPLRYAENNDTPGLLRTHTLAQAKMAAAAMLLLPGVPLIFYGQEVGNSHELFHLPNFDPHRTMASYHPELHEFYKRVIALRRGSKALSEGTIDRVQRPTPTSVEYEVRLGETFVTVALDFRTHKIHVDGRNVGDRQ